MPSPQMLQVTITYIWDEKYTVTVMEHCPHQALDMGGITKNDNPIQHLIEKKQQHYEMKREKLQKECLPGIPGGGARVWVARGLGGGEQNTTLHNSKGRCKGVGGWPGGQGR